jgi:hypothetical protein
MEALVLLPNPTLKNKDDETVFEFDSATITPLDTGKVHINTEPRSVLGEVTRKYGNRESILYLVCKEHRMRTSLRAALIDAATNPQVLVDGEWQDEAWEDLFDAFPLPGR